MTNLYDIINHTNGVEGGGKRGGILYISLASLGLSRSS